MKVTVDLITKGEMSVVGRLVDATNASLLAQIKDCDPQIKVVYKPVAGERPLWDFPDGSLAHREYACLLYTSPSPRDRTRSRMPSSA